MGKTHRKSKSSTTEVVKDAGISYWNWLLWGGIITGIVFWAYSNSISSDWHFDDLSNIVNNYDIHIGDLHWSSLSTVMSSRMGMQRPLAYLSFALNYYTSGLEVEAYHWTNLLLHLGSMVGVFLVTNSILNRWHGALPLKRRTLYAFLLTGLWVCNPLQTQAVTYVVQRMTVLAGFFYLFAFWFYLRGRGADAFSHKIYWFGGALLCGLASFASKENSLILPFFILLYEWIDYTHRQGWIKSLCLSGVGVCLTLPLLTFLFWFYHIPRILRESYPGREFSMLERLLTEGRVVIFHLTQLILPLPSRLALHHEYPLSKSLLSPITTLLALVFIISLFVLALWQIPRRPLLSFWILWYFVNLAIESTILPLEIIFEHRLYIPSVGFFGVLLFPLLASEKLWRVKNTHRMVIAGVFLWVALSAYWTHERNGTWANDLTLWEDNRDKYPTSFRVQNNLATLYDKKGDSQKAEAAYLESIWLNPKTGLAKANLALLYVTLGKMAEAKKWAWSDPTPDSAGYFDYARGVIQQRENNLPAAADQYRKAIKNGFAAPEAYYNLGLVCFLMNQKEEARRSFQNFLWTWVGNPEAPEVKKAQAIITEITATIGAN
jgi:protein O-mannosyl-transferase